MLDPVNDAAFSMFKRFLPLQFFDALERKHSDIKHRKVSAFGLMVLTFAEDLTPRALTAAANRATYEQALATVWQHRETAIEFHKRYDENLQRQQKLGTSKIHLNPEWCGGEHRVYSKHAQEGAAEGYGYKQVGLEEAQSYEQLRVITDSKSC